MVDDRDVALADPLREILGAATRPAATPVIARRRLTCRVDRREPAHVTPGPRSAARSDRSTSSRACRRACADSPTPASIREISFTRASSSSSAALATVRPVDFVLRHQHLRVGEGGDLREVRHAQHLVLPAQRRQRAPDRGPGLAADPRVDLVEDEGRRRLRQHDAQREHRPRELAAGRGLRERARRLAGVGREQEGHVVGAVVAMAAASPVAVAPDDVSTSIVNRPPGSASSRRWLVTAVGEPGAAARRAFESARGGSVDLGERVAPRGVELRSARVVLFELLEPLPRRRAVLDDVGERRPVLALQLAQQRAARACTVLQPLRDRRRSTPPSCARRARLPGRRLAAAASRSASAANGCAPGRARPRPRPARPRPDRRARGTRFPRPRGAPPRRRAAPPPRGAVVLVGVVDPRGRRSRRPGSAAGRPRVRRERSSPPSAASSSANPRDADPGGDAAPRARPGPSPREAVEQRALLGGQRAATGARAGRAGRRGGDRARRARPTVASRPST